MSLEVNGRLAHDEGQNICFSESMDWQSLQVISDEVTIMPISGNHRTGSSQIKVKNIVDSAWERTFHWGNLVTTHHSGQYFAYALTVPGKAAGMVRVLRSHCSDRIILKGFHGFVRDLSFAFHDKRILVAAVDEFGYLLVHEIIGAEVKLVLQVNPDSATSSSENHRVIWCPYVPEKENDMGEDIRDDSNDHALLLAASHDSKVEIWHLGIVNGVLTYQSATFGAMLIQHCEKPVVDVAFSPDSTAVAVASLDGFVRFFLVNTEKKEPQLLHKWQPHGGKPLSGVTFLDNLSNPNSESPLWKWAVTSADHNTEFKLWSCEQWECHQTIRFHSPDSSPMYQKMALDLSASFLLVSDIHRKVLYVMHIEQTDDGGVSKVTSITQLLLPFSAISLAIRQASLKPLALQQMGVDDEDFCGEADSSRVIMKLLVVQPKSVQKCKAVFQLGTSSPLGEGIGSSFSQTSTSINTSISEYEAAAAASTTSTTSKVSTNHIDLLTPDAFVSPAKSNINSQVEPSSVKRSIASSPVTPASMPLPPPTPNEILALSSPRRPTPDVTSSTTPKRNGIQSGGSSPSREVEEILGTRPLTEGSVESPDTSSATVPSGSALQDALAAYPSSLSPAFMRTASSKEASPVLERYKPQTMEAVATSTAAVATSASAQSPHATPANGSLMELFKEVLAKPSDMTSTQSITATPSASTWPTVLPAHVQSRPKEQRLQDRPEGDSALQNIQQTLSQLVSAFSAQQSEYQRLRADLAQLRTDLNRIESTQTAFTAKPQWLPQLESTLAHNFDRQQKKLEEMSAPNQAKLVAELQAAMRSELDSKTHALEQRTLDFVRKELQSMVASQVSRMEPVLKGSALQMLTNLATNKTIIETYSQATSAMATSAMHKTCKEVVTQHMLPGLDRSFGALFTQLHDTFNKGINEFIRNMETHMERHRRLQEKESAAQLNATLDKMRTIFDQSRESATADSKSELRKIAHDIPDQVGSRLIPMIHSELQRIAQDQKAALDGALMAVQQVTQSQSRAPTPAIAPSTPMLLQAQLKQLISQGQLCEAFQRALSVSDLNMVLFLCERVDAQRLFSTTPCVLPQPVLLSLIQQLSADLGTSTELKLNYLQEAVCSVDVADPVTKEHAPTVMAQLVRQLQSQVSAHGTGALSSQIRLLLLAAQRLQKV